MNNDLRTLVIIVSRNPTKCLINNIQKYYRIVKK